MPLKNLPSSPNSYCSLNWHWGELNMRPQGGANSQVLSQYHQGNLSGLILIVPYKSEP
ncbi:hypothetical protein MTR_1g070010 [Medicago truncatula]|uniref:Uncharacterized protein n=1 Tax=Medicago truncatula TaxID=3880 RepID=A0A072VWR7_MEDTR|nr:hypothetical protein MTR_1g070010 [Medicago truncatula]